MNSSLPSALDHLRSCEGGYVNHPRDPGGCTNFGITLATYRQRLNPAGTCRDLKGLTWEQAAGIYRDHYWTAVSADALPPGLDLLVFDHAVNAGPDTAVRILQRLLDVERDGRTGPVTLAAIAARPLTVLIAQYAITRLAYYRSLKTWPTFGLGWTKRVTAARVAALALADPQPATQKKSP